MRLLRIRIENINSLEGVHEIDLTAREYAESGIFAITGPTGSGKTSILDAVTLALFGTTPRILAAPGNLKTEEGSGMVMTKNAKRCSASVTFENGGRFWRSTWSVRAKTRKGSKGGFNAAEVELAELSSPEDERGRVVTAMKRAWDDAVQRVLGMDLTGFTRSVLLAQGAFAGLLKSTVDERADILGAITGTEIYGEIGCVVRDRVNEAAAERTRIEGELSGLRPMTDEERETAERDFAAAGETAAGRRRASDRIESEIGWIRRSAAAESERAAAMEEAARLEAEASAREADRTRAEAARRAVRPLETARRVETERKECERHAAEAGRLDLESKALAPELVRLAEAARNAQASEKLAREAREAGEPELLAMEGLDRTVGERRVAAAATASALMEAERRRQRLEMEAEDSSAAAATLGEELARARAERDRRSRDRDLPQAAAAIEVSWKSLEGLSRAALEARAALEKASSAEAASVKRAEAAKAKLAAAREADAIAAGRVAEAEERLAIASAGSSLEAKVAQMREAAGLAWAGEWLVETTELLHEINAAAAGADALEGPAGELVRRLQEALERRALRLRGRFSELTDGIDAKGLEALKGAAEEILDWSRKAGEAQKTLEAAREAASAAAGSLAKLESAADRAADRVADARGMKTEAGRRFDAAAAAASEGRDALEAMLRPFMPDGWRMGEDLSAEVAGLAQRSAGWLAAESAAAGLQPREAEARAKAEGVKRHAQEAKEISARAAADTDAAAAALKSALTERRERFGKRSPADERKALEASETAARTAREQAEKTELAARGRLERLGELAAKSRAEAQASQERLRAAGEELLALLGEAGFTSLAEAQAAAMPESERARLERSALDFEKRRAASAKRLGIAQESCGRLLAEAGRPSDERRALGIAALEEELAAAKAMLQDALRAEGAVRQRIEDDRRVREQHAETLARLEAASNRLALWTKLDGLVGGKDGKLFKRAAQRLTFSILLSEANEVLREMRSRYELVSSGDSGLELSVRDLDLAGIERTSLNLSGGETFLVSLALAIALSRVNARRLRVDTLFLDEGFGALDPAALEKALSALESLQQSSGKLIGLISHVAAVRDRVGVRIAVKPKGSSGRSGIVGPGVREISETGAGAKGRARR
mgnify:FL=1